MKSAPLTGVRAEMNTFLGAVIFLTRIPVGSWHHHRAEDLPRSAVYFPFIGALVGLCGSLTLLAIYPFLPPLVTVLIVMAVMVLLTGGLHEDGLADAADGLVGGQSTERRLEIMKDSRIGSYGAMALWFGLTAKLLLLDGLLHKAPFLAFCALIAANTLGRMSTVALLFFCRYARIEPSKASPFGNAVHLRQFLIAGFCAIVTVLIVLRAQAVICFLTALLVTWGARLYFQQKLGGITGDCLGATNQIVELACYLVLLLPLPVGAA